MNKSAEVIVVGGGVIGSAVLRASMPDKVMALREEKERAEAEAAAAIAAKERAEADEAAAIAKKERAEADAAKAVKALAEIQKVCSYQASVFAFSGLC